MQTSDQSSEADQHREPSQVKTQSISGPVDHTEEAQGDEQQSVSTQADGEAVRNGLIYPPPPAFYREEPVVQKPHVKVAELQQVLLQTPANVTGQHAVPTSYAGDPFSGPYLPYPGYPYPALARRQSYAWIWILVGVIGALILSACGLFAWISYSVYGETARSLAEAQREGPLVVNDFYSALQAREYEQAFSYLHPQSSDQDLSREQFIQQASERDQQAGTVRSFATGEPQIDIHGNEAAKSLTITVEIERDGGETYTAHLVLTKNGDTWKISKFDRI